MGKVSLLFRFTLLVFVLHGACSLPLIDEVAVPEDDSSSTVDPVLELFQDATWLDEESVSGEDVQESTAVINRKRHCGSQADVALVVDTSMSVDTKEWRMQASFMDGVIKGMNISDREVHYGVSVFAHEARELLKLNSDVKQLDTLQLAEAAYKGTKATRPKEWNKNQALCLCFGPPWSPKSMFCGKTDFAPAFTLAGNILRGSSRGVPKIALFLTDGKPTDKPKSKAVAAANALKAEGIIVMMIVIGTAVTTKDVEDFVSVDPIVVHSFDALDGAISTITSKFAATVCAAPTAAPTRPTPGPTEPTAAPVLATPLPTPKPTPRPTKQPTLKPTPSPTPKPTPRPTKQPTLKPTPPPSGVPTPGPTEPTAAPVLATPSPSGVPTPGPTEPTAAPILTTPPPSGVPTPGPTEPTAAPILITPPPSPAPSATPTEPTAAPIPPCGPGECYCVSRGDTSCDGAQCMPNACELRFFCTGAYSCHGDAEEQEA